MRFHHIAVATDNLKATVEAYTLFGYSASHIINDPIQETELVFLTQDGHPSIELVQAMHPEGTVTNILAKVGVTAYHICYEVNDLDSTLKNLRSRRFLVIRSPVNAKAFDDRRIAFVYSKATGLIELLESSAHQ